MKPSLTRNQDISIISPCQRGLCLWFTGFSGSGKSTTAERLVVRFLEVGRQVTFLDGDAVRTHLTKGLGFSREDRDTNIRRIGFVAAEIVRHGGIVVCATISPYRGVRDEVRQMVGHDRFVEVFVDTPLEECQRRDPKGLYAKASSGQLSGLTGVDDPYEPPLSPELRLETIHSSPEANMDLVLDYLKGHGLFQVQEVRADVQFHTGNYDRGDYDEVVVGIG